MAHAGEAAADSLRRFLNSDLNSTYRSAILTSLAEAIGEGALEDIRTALHSDDRTLIQAAVQCLQHVTSVPARAILLREAVSVIHTRDPGSSLQIEIARILADNGDANALFEFASQMDVARFQNETPDGHVPIPLANLSTRLEQLGIGRPVTAADLLTAIQSDPFATGISELNRWVQYVLEQAGIFVCLNAAPDRAGEDSSLQQCAEASLGRFSPQAVFLERPLMPVSEDGALVVPDRLNGDFPEIQPVRLQFVMNDRVYRLATPGGWLDLKSSLELINLALKDAGCTERFTPFETGGSAIVCLFGEPEAIEQLTREFRWPSCRDADQIIHNARQWLEAMCDRIGVRLW